MCSHQTITLGRPGSSECCRRSVHRIAGLKQNATAIIVAHNHPSGACDPNPEDRALTMELIDAGKLLGVEVLDHLVIGRGRWTSLRQSNIWR